MKVKAFAARDGAVVESGVWGRRRKEMDGWEIEMRFMYVWIDGWSRKPVVRRMVIEYLFWIWIWIWRSFASSTIDTMCPMPGAGYNTIVSCPIFGLLVLSVMVIL